LFDYLHVANKVRSLNNNMHNVDIRINRLMLQLNINLHDKLKGYIKMTKDYPLGL